MLVLIVALSFASARLTRLFVRDTILDGPRNALQRDVRTPKKVVELLTCPWCMSFWVNLIVWGVTWIFIRVPAPALTMLASWGGAQLAFWVTEASAERAT